MLAEEQIAEILRERQWKIATAEACTGGMIGSRLNSVPGASRFFPGGVIAYSHASKTDVLGIPADAFQGGSSVNRDGVILMAKAVREMFDADIAISESGVGGPTGGNPDRPVGTFFIGIATRDGFEDAAHHVWDNNRSKNMERATQAALELALGHLQQNAS